MRSGAEFVEKAAAGILAVYSAVLGVVFSVSDKAPLPVRGLIPAIFLALALVLAAFFLALPKGIVKVGTPADTVTDPREWFEDFTVFVAKVVYVRSNYLNAALVALMWGAVFLPAPFISVGTSASTTRRGHNGVVGHVAGRGR